MSELRPRSNGSSKIKGIARHGRLKKSGPWGTILSVIGAAVVVVLVSGISVGGIVVSQLQQAVGKGSFVIKGEEVAAPPTIGAYPGGYNILIVGSDTRQGQNGIGGDDGGSILNDVTMLLHVSADHTNATAVSIPRDMIVPIPACDAGGPASGLPMNTALYYGGSNSESPGKGVPCVVKTVEQLTGLKIQFAGLVTFKGVIEMTNAIGGVQVCTVGRIDDPNVGLHLASGTHTLKGYTALKFLRSRHGVGDGSDLGRISSQQVYLSALVRKLKSADTLSNPGTLYKIATAATRNMQLSTSLNSVDTMFAIAQSLKNIPLDSVNFVQYPGTTGGTGIYAGKVQPLQVQADALFNLIKADKPFKLADASGENHGGSVVVKPPKTSTGTKTSTSTPTPTKTSSTTTTTLEGVTGQSAGTYTCSKAYSG
jgi:LCP family protein required for cell wall assembly